MIIGSPVGAAKGAAFFSFFSFFGFSTGGTTGTMSLTGDLGRSLSLYPRSNLRSPSPSRPSSFRRFSFHLNPPPPRFDRSSSRLRLGDRLLVRSSRRGDDDLDLGLGMAVEYEDPENLPQAQPCPSQDLARVLRLALRDGVTTAAARRTSTR